MTVNFQQTPKQNTNQEEQEALMDKINGFLLKFSKVPLKEKLFFVQHLGIMLKAGISLSAALNTLAEQSENAKFKKILSEIGQKVESGITFTDSLKGYNNTFGELFINMIEAGEISGKLENVLARLYIQLKKQHELISKVKGALTYPAVIIIAMLGIGTFMMTVVVPRITGMFKDLNAELPLPTKILIGASDALVQHGVLSAITFILIIVSLIKILKTYKGKFYFQSILLKLPIFGAIAKKINIAQFARTVSSLLKTDIMIIKTFQIAGNVLNNLHYREALLEISNKIKKGSQINDILKNYKSLFPPVIIQMVAVGEQTGELDSILEELADFYENEVDKIMENLPALIEPILILALGLGVGAMAVAIIMPMYAITTAI